jgi:hypothetical protein
MAKLRDLSKGDRVGWKTSQGKTTGTVVDIKTKPFSIKGTDLKASKDKPKVVVRSEKTGAKAGHKPSALQKLKDAVTKGAGGKGKDDGKGRAKAKGTSKAKAKAKGKA